MMIVMKPTATEDEIQAVIDRIESVGAKAHPSRGEEVTVIGAIGDREHVPGSGSRAHPASTSSCRSSSRTSSPAPQLRHGERSIFDIGGPQGRRRALRADRRPVHGRVARPDADDRRHRQGGRRDDVPRRRLQAAHVPVRVQGLGQEGLRLLAEAKERTGLPIVTELHGRARPGGRCSRSPTSSRSARATCRTTRCSARSAAPASRRCSSAACARRSRSC